jgi:hypothetical protein
MASRSIRSYINSADSSLDEDTMTTLIMTNDVLTIALSKHQKAVRDVLQRQEQYQTENARIINVADPYMPDAMPIISPVSDRGEGRREPEYERRRMEQEVPDSPVSPVVSFPRLGGEKNGC